MFELVVEQQGFHGRSLVPIRGTNWRAWNALHVAVDMTADDERRMFAAAKTCSRSCECGGLILPSASDAPGTWLVPVTWLSCGINPSAPSTLPREIAQAAEQVEAWATQAISQ
jgi:hypothetical protein